MQRIEKDGQVTYKFDEELDALREAGFTEEQVEAIMNCAYAVAHALVNR